MAFFRWLLSNDGVRAELIALAAKISETVLTCTEHTRKIRELERELEDLHAAYRRLRASKGGVARSDTPPDPETAHPGDRKAQLRAKARNLVLMARGGGRGET